MGRVQPIDLWGLKSNCNGIVFPPISSTASKLLIDRREMRPPIPGAHPAAAAQDGHREAGTDHTCECVCVCVCGLAAAGVPCLFLQPKPNPPGWDPASSRRLNKIISFRDGPAVNQAALTYAKANEKRRKGRVRKKKSEKRKTIYKFFYPSFHFGELRHFYLPKSLM